MRALGCLLVVCFAAAAAGNAHAQARWIIDGKSSLAWWQVSPHLNHLWATTCPQDPDWRPGEGRSSGWVINKALKLPKTGYANDPDTIHVPLYPRHDVKPICTEAVRGQMLVPDTITWKGARGMVAVQGDALLTGENMRDMFAHRAVLQTQQYPDIRFTLDSLVDIRRQADTIRGNALGTFSLHGVAKTVRAVVVAYPEAGGVRVLAKFRLPALSLLDDYGFSHAALGLGVGTGIWQDLFMGVDLLMRLEGNTGN